LPSKQLIPKLQGMQQSSVVVIRAVGRWSEG
jgi:hypothetical protein